uniref:Saposin B-type domain-containing protein n=1 Tax=Sphaeramia orbicularis TaxID=375764 RepID=A0A673CUP1_9TELE
MKTSSVLLVCILAACSVWTVHGRCVEISNDDQVQNDLEVDAAALKLPGLCWACKWTMNKLKKFGGANATAESLKSKLLSVCDEIGLLKPLCRKFVKKNLGQLIEELTTTDDVRTICVNVNACEKFNFIFLFFRPKLELPSDKS